MGLLRQGTTLSWEDAKKYVDYVREHGVIQFLNIYKKKKDLQSEWFQWGDEIEYMIIHVDDEKQSVQLSLRGHEVLEELMKEEIENPSGVETLWRPEYGRHMVEGTPGKPYCGVTKGLKHLEKNIKLRRELIKKYLLPDERVVTLTSFPRMGCKEFTHPTHPPHGEVALSDFLPDEIINPHFRFSTLTKNIRLRRGEKVDINLPLYRDKNTPAYPFKPSGPDSDSCNHEGKHYQNREYNIHMDAMGFGMGLCCLQCTFQANNVTEARFLYDQLVVLSPIMLCLSAAAPAFNGLLADVDVRWSVISQSVDDRTAAERGVTSLFSNGHSENGSSSKNPLENPKGPIGSRFIINKSRYDSVDCYISADPSFKPEYNDVPLVYDKNICKQLQENGIDELLSRHIAHLFIRDPLVIYSKSIELDDEEETDHFENVQSTNWQTVRFKPPPPHSTIGWRVEFRPQEVQITDFENAAFVAFIVLLVRAIAAFGLNFYIPISKVETNMATAHKRGAVISDKFYFRKHIIKDGSTLPITLPETKDPDAHEPMSINEIINGKPGEFPGLITVVRLYLRTISVDLEGMTIINRYLDLISRRASGELMTCATWIRHFITNHKEYQHDSRVTDKIQYDLFQVIERVQSGEIAIPEMFGDIVQ